MLFATDAVGMARALPATYPVRVANCTIKFISLRVRIVGRALALLFATVPNAIYSIIITRFTLTSNFIRCAGMALALLGGAVPNSMSATSPTITLRLSRSAGRAIAGFGVAVVKATDYNAITGHTLVLISHAGLKRFIVRATASIV